MASRKSKKKSGEGSGIGGIIFVAIIIAFIIEEYPRTAIIIAISFVALIVIILVLKKIIRVHRQRKRDKKFAESMADASRVLHNIKYPYPVETDMYLIDNMEGHEFERFCAGLIQHHPKFEAESVWVTSESGDYGADVVLKSANGLKTVFQCKRYSNSVGLKSVQEVNSAREHYHADAAAVMTNNYYTQAAIQLANECRVFLYDRNDIMRFIAETKNLPKATEESFERSREPEKKSKRQKRLEEKHLNEIKEDIKRYENVPIPPRPEGIKSYVFLYQVGGDAMPHDYISDDIRHSRVCLESEPFPSMEEASFFAAVFSKKVRAATEVIDVDGGYAVKSSPWFYSILSNFREPEQGYEFATWA